MYYILQPLLVFIKDHIHSLIMNRKTNQERARILHCLVEGNSVRGTARLNNCSKNTVSKLLVEVGQACLKLHQDNIIDLNCPLVEVDEIWSYIGKRKTGVWTWIAICPKTKLIISYLVGRRDLASARFIMRDIKNRLCVDRLELVTDGYTAYNTAVEETFGFNGVDYAQTIKVYNQNPDTSLMECTSVENKTVLGNPTHFTTSIIERQNLTMRTSVRRLSRKTNAFSKKYINHVAAISLYFFVYNFVRIHRTIKTTPAMEAGVTNRLWSFEDLIDLVY